MAAIQRRRNQEGANFRVQVRLRGHPPVSATFERLTDARRWAQQTEAAIREGRYFPTNEAKRHTLGDLVDRQLEAIRTKRPHDFKHQQSVLGWWKSQLGAYTLNQCTSALIAECRDRLLAENIGTRQQPRRRSPATVNRYLAALSKAFSVAVREWHWLTDNPVRRVSKEREAPGRVRYLSDDERKALLRACKQSALTELHLIVLLALTTGMRRGELLGLRWPDIDLKRSLIVLQKTKNGERRSVPVLGEVATLLRSHAKVRRLDSDLVFAGASGRPVAFDAAWYAALERAGVEDFRFHDLRHTAASYLAMSGATTPEIAAVLGHKTLAMVKRYAHLSDQHTGALVERMAQKYFRQSSGE